MGQIHGNATALTIGNTKALSGHQCGQTPLDNVLNDFESINFVQSEKLRCVCRHQNPWMVNLLDGNLNLGHYNFAVTNYVKAQ